MTNKIQIKKEVYIARNSRDGNFIGKEKPILAANTKKEKLWNYQNSQFWIYMVWKGFH